jgi:hypothetical protein
MVNGVPVVVAPEEIDASNSGWPDAVLWEAADRGHGTFVVDMTRTQFCDSGGLGGLGAGAQSCSGRWWRAAAGQAYQRRGAARARAHRHRPGDPQLPQPVRGRGTGASHRPPATAAAAAPHARDAHPPGPATARRQLTLVRNVTGTTQTGSPAPHCRTPPCARPGHPPAPGQPARAGSRTAPTTP